MKTLLYKSKLRYRLHRLFYNLCRGFYGVLYFIKMYLPYEEAKVHIAYRYYQKTSLYRERLVYFGPEFARQAYIDFGDYRHFSNKLTREDKIKAFFCPYSCIGRDTTL